LLSITGCSFLYFSITSRNNSRHCRCFSFRSRLRASWCFLNLPARARVSTHFSSLVMHGIVLILAFCSSFRNQGRRGSIDQLIEHTNIISSFSGFMPR
jgi:hypothetical protein